MRTDLYKYTEDQRSEQWFINRTGAANSSAYLTMMNVFGNRQSAMEMEVDGERLEANFCMRVGTVFEDTSGFIFTGITGLEYEELGSVPHLKHPKIRGSVDGVGKDFILETKTPSRHEPKSSVENYGYYCQMIQNTEIIEADYALFNNDRILPVMTHQYDDPLAAYSPEFNYLDNGPYLRYNMANGAKSYATCCEVISNDKTLNFGKYAPNCADLILAGQNGEVFEPENAFLEETLLYSMIMSPEVSYKPLAMCDEQCLSKWKDDLDHENSNPKIMFRNKIINIQRVEKNTKFFEECMVPVAMRWINDFIQLKETGVYNEEPVDFPYPVDAPESVVKNWEDLRGI